MVASLARQAVIIKSGNDSSILTGNYELAYALGFLAGQAGIAVPLENPDLQNLRENILKEFEGRTPEDENTKQLVRMVKRYNPTEEFDAQMTELLQMGLEEKNPWDVHH